MADGRKNTPGMIGATAAMGFIVGLYAVMIVLFIAPQTYSSGDTLGSLLLPFAASAIGALVGVAFTRQAAASSSGRGNWSQASTA